MDSAHSEREATPSSWAEGDASAHLEELADRLPVFAPQAPGGNSEMVELVGQHLRMAGTMPIGQFRRISDFLNNQEGLIAVRDATVLRRNGEPTDVRAESIWITPEEVTLVAQNEGRTAATEDLRISKVPVSLVVVTPGHTLTGEVYINADAELALFIESPTPTFIPMSDVRTRSLADRRIIARYPFALLNRRHIVAATPLVPGMVYGRDVL
jgi:hypothetical protein